MPVRDFILLDTKACNLTKRWNPCQIIYKVFSIKSKVSITIFLSTFQWLLLVSKKNKFLWPGWKLGISEIFSQEFQIRFSILAVGQNRKLGNKKTRNNFSEISEISDFSEFSICHFFIFQNKFFSIF